MFKLASHFQICLSFVEHKEEILIMLRSDFIFGLRGSYDVSLPHARQGRPVEMRFYLQPALPLTFS
jgi:hypothetical protein